MISVKNEMIEVKGEPDVILAEMTSILREVSKAMSDILEMTREEVVDMVSSVAKMTEQEAIDELRNSVLSKMDSDEFKNLPPDLKEKAVKIFDEFMSLDLEAEE